MLDFCYSIAKIAIKFELNVVLHEKVCRSAYF